MPATTDSRGASSAESGHAGPTDRLGALLQLYLVSCQSLDGLNRPQ